MVPAKRYSEVRFPKRLWRSLFITLLIFSASHVHAMVDMNANGMSDIWEWLYNAVGVPPGADPDGDKFSNQQEATAGTNPFNSNSFPQITMSVYAATNFSASMPCQMGKQYTLLSTTNLGGTNWTVETNVVVRSGTNVTLTASAAASGKFYRIAISDYSSSGGGLSDWECYQLGLDPSNPYSNGQQDGSGNALSDFTFVLGKLKQQNVVTIAATATTAVQPDPGASVTGTGQFTITRGGFPLDTITVNLAVGGSGAGYARPGVDFAALPSTVTFAAGVSSVTLNVTPMADTNLQTPALAQLNVLPGSYYTVGLESNAGVVIYPSPTATGAGLLGQYYTNSSTTYTNAANFNPTNLFLTRVDPTINFVWSNSMSPNLSNGYYSVRWTGQIEPQFSETYVFAVLSDDGCKLWVNDQLLINEWQSQSGGKTWTNAIALQAGVAYDIRLEYLQAGASAQAHLSWYSPSQPEEVVPSTSLYATNRFIPGTSNSPSFVTSALSAVAFVGQPFTFTVTGANTPLGFSATGLPPGLALNNTNGLISGVPTLAGNFAVSLISSNKVGLGASVLNISVLNNSSAVVQEIWTNVTGYDVADIPTNTPASVTNTLATLEGVTGYGTNYGERIRGYFTAPATANYYFWIAASDSAQLWVSDDSDPVNKVLRSSVQPVANPAAPPQYGTGSRQWNTQTGQRSPWLYLTAGQSYYVEILHKAGVETGDNWSVGWLQDPFGTNTVAGGITPGYLLSTFYPPLPANIPGTLYSANMLALPGVNSQGVGSATLRVNAAGTQATLNFAFSNLKGTPTGQSINSDPFEGDPSELIFDISAAKVQPNGSYVWTFKNTGPLTVSNILQIIDNGESSINVESSAFPNGEISGHFTATDGSQTFTPPPAPPAWTDDSANSNAAVRFLSQATFGPAASDIASVQSMGYASWITNQFTLPATHSLPFVLTNANANPTAPYQSYLWFDSWWRNSVTAPDQLRQRVAFALSEILVISENGVLVNHATALSSYYDMLLDNAFGNFRTIMENVTLHPAMGMYLDMLANNAGSEITGLHADENYAREVEQLFSIGLNREWPDGTLILNAEGNLVPTYNQNVIMGFASVFTGWNYYQTNQANGRLPTSWYPAANYTNSMALVPSHHELGTKLLLDNVMLPAAQGSATNSGLTNFDYYCAQDLEQALNCIFNNQNVGPFICHELIQRLVTSCPSKDYVYRVAEVFNNDGTGVRGNMQAVISAILLDYEARSPQMIAQPGYGKQREALLRVTHLARAFPAPAPVNGTYTQGTNQTITVTTAVPHRLCSGDTVFLNFTDGSSNAAPTMQGYSVTLVNMTNFTITAPQLLTGTYAQSNGFITVAISGFGLLSNSPVYLTFTTGGATNGLFTVASNIDTAHFLVATTDLNTRAGNCLLAKITAAGYAQSATTITVSTTGPHGLLPGSPVYIIFTTGTAVTGTYSVNTVPDPAHFTIVANTSATQTQSGLLVYSLASPPSNRSGTVTVNWDTWNLGYTDSGGTSSLMMSPLRSPTVFNFFYPGYEFPGALASAGLTTPEFQLTTATDLSDQMNFIEGAVLGNTGNTNGLCSFASGNGCIVMDMGPWMTTNYTANAGIPALVGSLNTYLAAGQLSATAQSDIVSYVASTNFGYSTPPTYTQMRDRVRAVVHLIASSPDYVIQK